MKTKNAILAFVLAPLLLAVAWPARADDTVKVKITITIPKDTDEKATLYLAGSLKEVGDWKAAGVKLTRNDDGTYTFEKDLPKGQTLEYKINGGDWDTVEKGDHGQEVENHKIELDGDKDEKITVQGWGKMPSGAPATEPAPKLSTLSGDVRKHVHFVSKILGNERSILVWLPPQYETDTAARFPVLYMHDGQNCFDAATSFAGEWRADETAGELIAAGKIAPIIVVAVANAGSARMDEYTPTRDASANGGGKGELYAKFLIDEVKPFIDTNYRTLSDRKHTAVAGSSLGGLMSLYLGYRHGDVFSMCGVISPSLWWDDCKLLKEIQADATPQKQEKIWLDIGTAEGSKEGAALGVANVNALADTLAAAGMQRDTDFAFHQYEGAEHNEKAWAARFGEVLQFLFPV